MPVRDMMIPFIDFEEFGDGSSEVGQMLDHIDNESSKRDRSANAFTLRAAMWASRT